MRDLTRAQRLKYHQIESEAESFKGAKYRVYERIKEVEPQVIEQRKVYAAAHELANRNPLARQSLAEAGAALNGPDSEPERPRHHLVVDVTKAKARLDELEELLSILRAEEAEVARDADDAGAVLESLRRYIGIDTSTRIGSMG